MDTVRYLKDLLWAIRTELLKFRVWVALIFSIVLLVVVGVAFNWPKYYVSNATIVKDITNVIEPLLRGAAEVADIDKNEKIGDVIFSRPILASVLERVHPDYPAWSPEELAIRSQQLRSGLSVQRVPGTNLTRISYSSSDPELAYKTVSAVVEVFIGNRMADKQKKSHEAHDFISKQVDQYKFRLLAAEEKLKIFKSNSVDESELTVKTRISELESEIQELVISIDESQERIKSTKRELAKESENVTLRQKVSVLEDRKSQLVDQLDQLRLYYQDSYPDIITLKLQISEVEDSLRALRGDAPWGNSQKSDLPLLEELRKQLSTSEVEMETKKRRLIALRDLLTEEKLLADEVASNQAELTERTRDYDVTKKLYEEMLQRKENAKLTLALNDEGQGEIYRMAESPVYPLQPDGIRALFIYLVAPVIAFFVPLGMVGAFILLDPRIRSSEVLNQIIPDDVPLVACVPHRKTRLASKILRKDIFVIGLIAISLMAGYFYVLYYYWDRL